MLTDESPSTRRLQIAMAAVGMADVVLNPPRENVLRRGAQVFLYRQSPDPQQEWVGMGSYSDGAALDEMDLSRPTPGTLFLMRKGKERCGVRPAAWLGVTCADGAIRQPKPPQSGGRVVWWLDVWNGADCAPQEGPRGDAVTMLSFCEGVELGPVVGALCACLREAMLAAPPGDGRPAASLATLQAWASGSATRAAVFDASASAQLYRNGLPDGSDRRAMADAVVGAMQLALNGPGDGRVSPSDPASYYAVTTATSSVSMARFATRVRSTMPQDRALGVAMADGVRAWVSLGMVLLARTPVPARGAGARR